MSLQKNVLEVMQNSSRSVFNVQSLRMLTDCEDSQKLTQSLHYYIKEGKIRNPRRGIYTKATYDEKEWHVACTARLISRWSMCFNEQVSCSSMMIP